MSGIRFILLGGFLGAGKTTTIGRLAREYQRQGLRVGIVTNDQADDLVDTHTLREQGFDVGEVAGACFCCSFNDLTAAVETLGAGQRPDVVLAEPVGSCTDLVATVIQPLAQLFGTQFDVAPYGVILKPSHGAKILGGRQRAGFSPQAEYIFRKQLEEADFVIVNRIDELAAAEVSELVALLETQYPAVPVLTMSAKSGAGFAELLEMLDQRGTFGRRILEIDYDVYAAGEAELGWLNSRVRVTARAPFSLDDFLVGVVEHLRVALGDRGAETAHLKTVGLWEGFHGVANLISSDTRVDLSVASNCDTRAAEVVVNARVAIDPAELEELVVEAVQENVRQLADGRAEWLQTRSLRPGRPVPTHRLAAPAN